MLPLWIIDITQQSDRCNALKQIIGQIDRVLLQENAEEFLCPEESQTEETASSSNQRYEDIISNDPALFGKSKSSRVWNQFGVISSEEEKENEQEQLEKNARKGYLWYYTHFDADEYQITKEDYVLLEEDFKPAAEQDSDREQDAAQAAFEGASKSAQRLAPKIYSFQEALIAEGQRFMQVLLRSASSKYQAVNVCVIGDVSEDFSNLLFSSIAVMIQKEKGRIMPNHIHQGLSILGMLYIASNINSQKVSMRKRALYTLKEIEVQHRLPTVRGYDRILIFQDVQNKIERFYSQLDIQGQVEYLSQCLISLYYACNHLHPLISGSASEEDVFFSMGVSSASFDTTKQDEYDRRFVANELIRYFLEDGDHLQTDSEQLVKDDTINVSKLIQHFSKRSVDISKARVRHPSPAPYTDFLDKELKRLYYHQYLRDFPANLMYKLVAVTEESLNATLQEVAAQGKRMFEDFSTTVLPTGIDRIVKSSDEHTGCLKRVEDQLANLKKTLQQKKDEVVQNMEVEYWNPLIDSVPKFMRRQFIKYNSAYRNDISSRNGSKEQDKIKKECIDDLVKHLRVESTFIGRICKTFLLCVISAIAILPIFGMISPWLIDLGNVRRNAILWDVLICSIPIIWQVISLYRYERKKSRLVNDIRTCFLHDAYARLANRIISEAKLFFDKAGRLCVKYEERCESIRLDFETNIYSLDNLPVHSRLPETMFCQPLIGGKYCGERLVPKADVESSEVLVNYARIPIDDLTKSNYFTIMQTMHELFRLLFKQVYLIPDHRRRFNKDKNAYEFVSRQEEEEWVNMRWQYINTNFRKALLLLVRKQFCERKSSTIGEKLLDAKNAARISETLVKFAATNGDLTSTADKEFSDVKIGVVPSERIVPLFEDKMPNAGMTSYQVITNMHDEDGELYRSYLFLTRWRTFDSISYNRIFPLEDFDKDIERVLVNTDEHEKGRYEPSSLILWAMSRDEKSSEWLNLFGSDLFVQATTDYKFFKQQLNKRD